MPCLQKIEAFMAFELQPKAFSDQLTLNQVESYEILILLSYGLWFGVYGLFYFLEIIEALEVQQFSKIIYRQSSAYTVL